MTLRGPVASEPLVVDSAQLSIRRRKYHAVFPRSAVRVRVRRPYVWRPDRSRSASDDVVPLAYRGHRAPSSLQLEGQQRVEGRAGERRPRGPTRARGGTELTGT